MEDKMMEGVGGKVLFTNGIGGRISKEEVLLRNIYSNKKLTKNRIRRILKDSGYSISMFTISNSFYVVTVSFNEDVVLFNLPKKLNNSLFSITIYKNDVVLFINKGVTVA